MAQWVFKHSKEFRNRRHFPSKTAYCRFFNILQRLTLPRIIDQFERKRWQKKRKDVSYHPQQEFFKNILFYMNGRLSKIRSVHTYGVKLIHFFAGYCISRLLRIIAVLEGCNFKHLVLSALCQSLCKVTARKMNCFEISLLPLWCLPLAMSCPPKNRDTVEDFQFLTWNRKCLLFMEHIIVLYSSQRETLCSEGR